MPKGERLPLGRRRARNLLQIPSGKWNPLAREVKRIRLLAVTMVRDEARFLPGLLRNLAPQVDGIVALDDGSRDGSDLLLADCPQVLQLLRQRPDRPAYDEPAGLRRLVAAALEHGAGWIMAIDADETARTRFSRPRRKGDPPRPSGWACAHSRSTCASCGTRRTAIAPTASGG